ncbi:CDP-2,3-bis-(O-geranylgeranyl)-sn-glycerol synthase [archaeon]|nr:CDP-2,3-bis-(O-geranylgeranyl)-sn-glycerol synthase [archaeon]
MLEQVSLFLAEIIAYLLPAYIANSSAMLFGRGPALDFGITLKDGERLMVKGKTFIGSIAGIACGTLAAMVIYWFINVSFTASYALLGFLLSAGAITGDIIGSFIKRRNKIPSGQQMLFLDQLDFLVGAMILGSAVYLPSLPAIGFAVAFTFISHRLTNWIAFRLGLKKVPW